MDVPFSGYSASNFAGAAGTGHRHMGGFEHGIPARFLVLLRSHLAIAQDAMREDCEDRFARRTLDTPDGDAIEPYSDVMRVSGEGPFPATGPLHA